MHQPAQSVQSTQPCTNPQRYDIDYQTGWVSLTVKSDGLGGWRAG